jgi:excinuclease UvrABC helicase subunit UvrB
MIKFEATNLEELEAEAFRRAHEISVATLKAVCKGIEEDADAVSLAILSNLDMDISVKRQDYLEALELNIDRAAEVEEFELCTKARDYINQLKQERK